MNSEDMANFIKSLNPEQMAQFQQVFKTVSDTMDVKTKEEAVSSKVDVTEDFRVTSSKGQVDRGKTPVRARENSWKDDGSFQLEGDDEWSTTRKRTARTRTKATKVEVECSVCGKTFMENPNLIYGEYHRCNRCGRR